MYNLLELRQTSWKMEEIVNKGLIRLFSQASTISLFWKEPFSKTVFQKSTSDEKQFVFINLMHFQTIKYLAKLFLSACKCFFLKSVKREKQWFLAFKKLLLLLTISTYFLSKTLTKHFTFS